ncbi:MAG: acyl-CoA dehydrogenase family protein, partial [Tumebacillaceae bacterium]
MNFNLTQDQHEIRKLVRDFALNEVAPTAAERDEKEEFSREIFDKMAEIGLCGIPWPEEYGGAGMDYVSYVIAVEELSRVDASVGVTLSVQTSLAGWPIYKFGNEEQKQTYLRRLAEGTSIGAYGLTEPGSGTDAGGMRTTAVEKDDHWVLNGSKIFITNGGVADIYVVFAVTDAEKRTRGGITAFIVERGWEGFTTRSIRGKLGIRAGNTG